MYFPLLIFHVNLLQEAALKKSKAKNCLSSQIPELLGVLDLLGQPAPWGLQNPRGTGTLTATRSTEGGWGSHSMHFTLLQSGWSCCTKFSPCHAFTSLCQQCRVHPCPAPKLGQSRSRGTSLPLPLWEAFRAAKGYTPR